MRRFVPVLLVSVCTAAIAFAQPIDPRHVRELPTADRTALTTAISATNTSAQGAERRAQLVTLLAQAGYEVVPRAGTREFELLSPEVSSRPIVFTLTLYPTDTTAERFAAYRAGSSMPAEFNAKLHFSFQTPFDLPVISPEPERLSPKLVLRYLTATLAELPVITTRAPGPLRLDTERQRELSARTQTLLAMRKTVEAWRLEIENMDETLRTERLQNRGQIFEEAVGKLEEAVASLQEERLALADQPTP